MGVIVEYDTEARAIYLSLSQEPVSRTLAVGDLVSVDMDAAGSPIGLEILAEPGVPLEGLLDSAIEAVPDLRALGLDSALRSMLVY